MSKFNLSKGRIAAAGLLVVMGISGFYLYRIFEANIYLKLENHLSNQLIATSELIRHHGFSKAHNWEQLILANLDANKDSWERLDYLLLVDDQLIASSLAGSVLERIKNLNLQKISFMDHAFSNGGMLLRSSIISNESEGVNANLVLIKNLNKVKWYLLLYGLGIFLIVFTTFLCVVSLKKYYWRHKIIPFHRLQHKVKEALVMAGYYSQEKLNIAENDCCGDYLLNSTRELKKELNNLKVEWDDFFKGLSIAAIKLIRHEKKIISVWGASEHLNRIVAPALIDPKSPIESIFRYNKGFATSAGRIERQILSLYGLGQNEVTANIKQLPRTALCKQNGKDKKLFLTWTPCLNGQSFQGLILEIAEIGPYGQGLEEKQLKQLENQFALDLLSSGGKAQFAKVLTKIKEISKEIIETIENKGYGSNVQIKVRSYILEIRNLLIDAKQYTLSTHFTQLILDVMPFHALDCRSDVSKDYDWAQLSPIIVYIVNLAILFMDSPYLDSSFDSGVWTRDSPLDLLITE